MSWGYRKRARDNRNLRQASIDIEFRVVKSSTGDSRRNWTTKSGGTRTLSDRIRGPRLPCDRDSSEPGKPAFVRACGQGGLKQADGIPPGGHAASKRPG